MGKGSGALRRVLEALGLKKKKRSVLMLGLSNSGKTSIVRWVQVARAVLGALLEAALALVRGPPHRQRAARQGAWRSSR